MCDLQDRGNETRKCHGDPTTLRETTVLIKETPADVCQNCGEYYLDETVTRKVYAQAEEAVERRAEVEILRYAA
jgi:YgiT-type zinc finger domain-containing protein